MKAVIQDGGKIVAAISQQQKIVASVQPPAKIIVATASRRGPPGPPGPPGESGLDQYSTDLALIYQTAKL